MKLMPEQIEEQILQGKLRVSGGRDNPPDRYDFEYLTENPAADLAAINALADKGYRFTAFLPPNRVLMGNYKENK